MDASESDGNERGVAGIRDNVRSMFTASITDRKDMATNQVVPSIVDSLERGIYNWTIDYCSTKGIVKNWKNPKFKSLYMAKTRSVLANLMPETYVGNHRLLARLLEGEFAPKDLAYMRPENVCPEVWKHVLDIKLMRDQYSEKPEAMTDQYRCGRCKKRECVYQELQLRSSDEPMSLFITCLNCGNRWRLG